MDVQSQPPQKSIFKNPYLYSSFLILVVSLYVGWILYSRHQDNRSYDQRASQAQAKKQHQADRPL